MKEKNRRGQIDFENPELYMGEVEIGVSFTSFMTGVVFFFIGLLLTGDPSLQQFLRIPMLYLFMSAYGFLYSTLVYANASGEVARLRRKSFDTQMKIGNILSEYWGVYGLVFASPLVILGYSPDKLLALFVLGVSLLGFILYHLSGFSILERYFSRNVFLSIFSIMSLLHVGSFVSFYCVMEYHLKIMGAYYGFSILVGVGMIVIFLICMKREEKRRCGG